MAEKRGEIEKIKFDFNTAGCLEINHPKVGWHRVTAKDFRSFDGERRITEPEYTRLSTVEVPMVTREYFGPVFYWGTNKEIRPTNSGKIVDSPIQAKLNRISGSRK